MHPGAIVSHVAEQGAIVTPLLYLTLLGVLVDLARRALGGGDRAQLLVFLALPHLVVFLVASPVHDVQMVTMHWPAAGYLPLLVYLPATLSRLRDRFPTRMGNAVAGMVPASGALAVLVGLAFLTTGGSTRLGVLWEFEGWSEIAARVRSELATVESRPGQRKLVVADNYKLGANLEFGLHDEADVLILDHPVNHLHGRASAFGDWEIGEEELARRAGQEAVVVVQRDVVESGEGKAWLTHVRSRFEGLGSVEELRAGRGRRKAFVIARGVVADTP